jgi:hypothetical protein
VPGDVIALDPNDKHFVKKTTDPYDPNIIGVYSQKPGLRLSQNSDTIDGSKAVPVALVGRVGVRVSSKNGKIHIGDALTSSDIPGVAMRADKAGVILGKAMDEFSGDGEGSIGVFVTIASTTGKHDAAALFSFDNPPVAANNAQSTSEIYTDHVIAGLDIITPSLTTASVSAKLVTTNQLEVLGSGIFRSVVEFFGRIIFHGQVIFNNDAAGTATISKDSDQVSVNFTSVYSDPPLVTITPKFDNLNTETLNNFLKSDLRGVVVNTSTQGFLIKLNHTTPFDLSYAWIAVAVKDAKTFKSDSPVPTSTPSPPPSPSPALVPTPVATSSATISTGSGVLVP